MLKQSSGRQSLTDLLLWNLEPSFGCQGRCTSESETILPDLVGTQAELNRKTHWRDITISMACSMTLPATTTRCFEGYSVKHLHVHRCFVVSWDVISIIRFVYCLIWELPLQCEVGVYYILIHDGTVSDQVWLAGIHQPTVVQEATWQKNVKMAITSTTPCSCLSLNLKQILRCQVNWRIKKWLQNVHHLEFDSGKKVCWQWRPVAAVSRIYDLLRLNTSTQTFCHRMAAVNRNITSLGALAFSEALDDESEEVRQRFSALKIPGLTSSPWWPWWRLRVI